jgi:Rtf2 RING-finger
MGGDGGTHASSRQFIRGCKIDKPELDDSKSIKERQHRKATSCAQSAVALEEPVVICQLGNLYNKEAMVCALINKTLNPSFAHIRGLKDLKQTIFSMNPGYAPAATDANEDSVAKYVCPITRQDFNGYHPFVLIWSTGNLLVLHLSALRQLITRFST